MTSLPDVRPCAHPDHASDFDPTPVDEAWWAGFALGMHGHPASPFAGYSPECRDAFTAGHAAGCDAYAVEMAEWEADADSLFLPAAEPSDLFHDAERSEILGIHAASAAGVGAW